MPGCGGSDCDIVILHETDGLPAAHRLWAAVGQHHDRRNAARQEFVYRRSAPLCPQEHSVEPDRLQTLRLREGDFARVVHYADFAVVPAVDEVEAAEPKADSSIAGYGGQEEYLFHAGELYHNAA